MGIRPEGRRFDKVHRVVTEALLFLGELDAEYLGEAAAHATHYEAVPVEDFDALMAHVPETFVRGATFVDIGSGLGRAVFLAMRQPFKKIVGVEASAALNETAKENFRNLRAFPVPAREARFVNKDARTFDFPSGDLVVFMFNPFDAEALRATFAKMMTRVNPGRVCVLYHTPEHLEVAAEFGFDFLRVTEYAAVALPVDV